MSTLRSFALAVCVVAFACLALTGAAMAASIRGTVVTTAAVVPKKLPVTIDQYVCGTEKPGEELIVSRQGGVKNAVVWLQTPPPGAAWPSAPVKVEMDQKACVFVPRVVIVPIGGTVEFLNSDRLLHNLHSASKDNPTFNRTQPRSRVIPVTFNKAEIVQVNCDLHSWMRAWVVVAEHPYYAVTGDRGEFVLENVPPGKHTIRIWQESLRSVTQEVTVADTGVSTVTVEMTRP